MNYIYIFYKITRKKLEHINQDFLLTYLKCLTGMYAAPLTEIHFQNEKSF